MTSLATNPGVRSDGATGISLVMLAAALWATVGVAVQLTPDAAKVPDSLLAAARTGIGGPVLLAVWVFVLRGRLAQLRSLSPQPLAVFAIASTVFQICLFRCFDQLGVTVAVFLTVCLPPVLGTLWAALRGTGRLSRHEGMALGVALAGLALVAIGGYGPDRAGLTLSGLLHGMLASTAFVAMSLVAARMARTSPAIVVAGAGLSLSAVLLVAIAVLTAPHEGLTVPWKAVTMPTLVLVLYLGLLPTALAYLCYCRGMAKCRTPAVGLMASMVEPGLAALLAVGLLGEGIARTTGVGCVLLIGAMMALWQQER